MVTLVRILTNLLIAACLASEVFPIAISAPGNGITYYVRLDGGSATQCTGRTNTPYPGSGNGQSCAWNHPFQALPPAGSPRMVGGDTLIVGPGSYAMGYGAPGADACDADGAFDCYMPPIPSGPTPAQPTRILGAGWNQGCTLPPELWGTERTNLILNLTDASNVTLACLEITDHAGCVEFHSGSLTCERDTPPYGVWASTGMYAEDSAHVTLQDLNIHGLANQGIWAGRLQDWTVERVHIVANGWAGWNGDIDGNDTNRGTLLFRHWTVAWNGCGESWPDQIPEGCWAQEAGGYGDGVGTGETVGHWVIEDSAFLHNTSDGLDLLYARPGSQIEIRRTRAEGNAGNQIKTSGPITLENNIIIGNCGYFNGRAVTYNVDDCRAYGAALNMDLYRGDRAWVVNNTIAGEGDCLVVAECPDGGNCNGTERATLRNNIFQGYTDFAQPDERTCLIYQETFPADPFDEDYGLINGVKEDACPGLHDQCGVGPGLAAVMDVDELDTHLLSTSPAINVGLAAAAPVDDFDGLPRDANPDKGAYEWHSWTSVLYLPWLGQPR